MPPLGGIDWKDVHERLEHARRHLDGSEELSADDARRILESRAAALAQPPPQAAETVETLDLVVMARGQETYAVEAAAVAGVFPLADLTPVPFTPQVVLGVMNHRGRMLPVLDIGQLLQGAEATAAPSLVVAVEAETAAFGIAVDAVSGVAAIAAHELVPAQFDERHDGIVRGLTGAMAAVLDLDVLARDPRVEVNDEIE